MLKLSIVHHFRKQVRYLEACNLKQLSFERGPFSRLLCRITPFLAGDSHNTAANRARRPGEGVDGWRYKKGKEKGSLIIVKIWFIQDVGFRNL